jgi:hypothetical protein
METEWVLEKEQMMDYQLIVSVRVWVLWKEPVMAHSMGIGMESVMENVWDNCLVFYWVM